MTDTSGTELPARPPGLRKPGARLWDRTVAEFELSPRGLDLLAEAARTVDTLAILDRKLRKDGMFVDSPQGVRTAPWVVEARQQRLALVKVTAALGLDVPEVDR